MAPSNYGRSPSSRGSRGSYGSYGTGSTTPSVRKSNSRNSQGSNWDDRDCCVLDAKGHKEKLPRPLEALSIEGIYCTDSEKKGGSATPSTPSRTPNSGGHNSGEKNASRRYLYSTVDAVMLRPYEVANNLPIPLAAICCPFADGADSDSVPLVERNEWGPIRCSRCRSYANSYFTWSSRDSGKLLCNMCGHHLEVPSGFVEEMDRSAQNDQEHPEFVHGSVDYVAPSDIDVGRPQQPTVPTTCFVVESSSSAVRSGFFHAALHAIEHALGGQTPKMHRRVCLVTFDQAVYLHERTYSGGFREVTMCDIDDPFLPISPMAASVDIGDEYNRECFKGLLRHLQATTLIQPDGVSLCSCCSVAGAALRVCIDAVAQTGGGDVCMFHASSPSAGIGAILPAAPKDSTELQQEAFYQETLSLCVKGGVAVSTVVAPPPGTQLDLHTLQWLPWRTGGDLLHLPNFDAASCSSTLANHLEHWAAKMQASAYDCVFKLRCSKGLQCTSLLAPWPAASSADDGSCFQLPRLTPDCSFAINMKPEVTDDGEDDVVRRKDDKKKQLFIQAAILYTNGEGERLLRIHTTLISVAFSVKTVYQSVSVAPLVALMLKQAAVAALDRKKAAQVQPKDQLLNLCLQILTTYRRHCYTSDISQHCLVVSKTLSLFPLYILAARKLLYSFNLEKDDASRDHHLMNVLRMPIHSILTALYPCAHALPLPSVSEEGGGDKLADAVQDSQNLERALATPCPAMQEHVAMGPSPAYVINNGSITWLLKTESSSGLDNAAIEAISTLAAKASEQIQEKLQPTAGPVTLHELPMITDGVEMTWQEKVRCASLFVEDEGATEMSYTDWVEFLQSHVMHMVR